MQPSGTRFLEMRIPHVFMIVTWFPILLVVYFVPDIANNHFYKAMDNILDLYFFGRVGMWSSVFPFPTKIISNYVCFFVPFFAAIFTYLTFKNSTFERCDFSEHSLGKIIVLCLAWVVLVFSVLYATYLGDTDLGVGRQRFAVLGQYKFVYALFLAGTLYLMYIMTIATYFALKFFPELIVFKYKSIK